MDFKRSTNELRGLTLWVLTTAMLVVYVHYGNVWCFQTYEWDMRWLNTVNDDNDALANPSFNLWRKMYSLCEYIYWTANSCWMTARISVGLLWNNSPVHRLITVSSFRAESGSVIYTQYFQVPVAQQGAGSLLLVPPTCQILLKHTYRQRLISCKCVNDKLGRSWHVYISTNAQSPPVSPQQRRTLDCTACLTVFKNHRRNWTALA